MLCNINNVFNKEFFLIKMFLLNNTKAIKDKSIICF